MLVHAIPTNVHYDFAADVRDGLTREEQKELPSKYLYDDVRFAGGSEPRTIQWKFRIPRCLCASAS